MDEIKIPNHRAIPVLSRRSLANETSTNAKYKFYTLGNKVETVRDYQVVFDTEDLNENQFC